MTTTDAVARNTETLPLADIRPVLAGTSVGDDGRYTLDRLLGAGGMATVWSATDSRLCREVAVKVISDSLALDPAFLARFDREARLVAGLSHPNVVQVFDVGSYGGRPYLVMECVPGGTLADRGNAGLSGVEAIALARDLLSALGYVHGAGVLHRDLKPANVLLGVDGRLRLTDFGIAHLLDATLLTTVGSVFGTERYLAPELLAGGVASVRTDLYACGVLLAECTAAAPAPLRRLIEALTQSDPDARPANVEAALALLEDSTEPLASETSLPEPLAVATATPTRAVTAPMALETPMPMPAPVPPHPQNGTRSTRRRDLALIGVAGAALSALISIGALNEPAGSPADPSGTGSLSQQLDELDRAVDQARR